MPFKNFESRPRATRPSPGATPVGNSRSRRDRAQTNGTAQRWIICGIMSSTQAIGSTAISESRQLLCGKTTSAATLGGPVNIPGLYVGTNKTFFFFSYEGLRLVQPQAAGISDVPTPTFRASVPSALQPVLNAFPLPCAVSTPNCIADLGDGFGQFIGTWSNPSAIDAYNIRFDHGFSDKLKLFFRFSDTGSNSTVRSGGFFGNPAEPGSTAFTTRTYTVGINSAFSSRVVNEFRLNYSSNDSTQAVTLDNFQGAKPVNLGQLQGVTTSQVFNIIVALPDILSPALIYGRNSSIQKQWNVVDTTTIATGRHQVRFGVDFRRSSPIVRGNNPSVFYDYFAQSSVTSNNPEFVFGVVQSDAFPVYTNSSLFVQDDWRIKPRLNISLGLRWEINPAPGAADGRVPYTVQGSSLGTLGLAPKGTPLWNTTWFNFAPRLGVAYVLRDKPGWETVFAWWRWRLL